MKVLYLDCSSGVAGDMIMGALSDLMPESFDIQAKVASMGIPGVRAVREKGSKHHICGTSMKVLIDGEEEDGSKHPGYHCHRSLDEVIGIIRGLDVSESVKRHAEAIYRDIAEAESKVHGEPVSEIHFHEVGMLDAIADIVTDCMLIEELSPDEIIASPVRTGFGTVMCAHGELPVPAPATAFLLKGIPSYAGDVEGEFATPTGVAIVKHFAGTFGQRPSMVIDDIGCGLGRRDYGIPNVLRAFIGTAKDAMPEVDVLNCNIDDMTPEDLGSVIDTLLSEGALDAMITSVIMKKGRPGHMLTCLCRHEDRDRLATLILKNTSTIGIRTWKADRYEMASKRETLSTEFGDIRVKVSEGYGVRKWKLEHDDLVKAASENGVTVDEIRRRVRFEPEK